MKILIPFIALHLCVSGCLAAITSTAPDKSKEINAGAYREAASAQSTLIRARADYKTAIAKSGATEQTMAAEKEALLKISADTADKIHAARDAVVEANRGVLRVIHLKVNYHNYVSDERDRGEQKAPWLTVSLAKVVKIHNEIVRDNEELAKIDLTAAAQNPVATTSDNTMTVALRQIYKSIEMHRQRAVNVRFVIPLESTTNSSQHHDGTTLKKVDFLPCDSDDDVPLRVSGVPERRSDRARVRRSRTDR